MKEDGAPGRAYTNTLRREQAAQTRGRILDAAVELLAESGETDIAMPELAARAGVSLRTVYRNFPSKDTLLDSVADWITQRFEQRMGAFPTTRDDYAATSDMLHLVFELEPLYRALYASPAGRAAHIRSNAERGALIQRAFSRELKGANAAQRRRFAAVMHLLQSSNGVLFMHDYAGMAPDEIVRALRWAVGVLADAVADPDLRKEL